MYDNPNGASLVMDLPKRGTGLFNNYPNKDREQGI